MAIQFKKKCSRCKKNYVLASNRSRGYLVCYECDKGQMKGEITDKDMKEFFDIPERYYKDVAFLRSIKINYLRFGSLSENQINAFKKVVKEMKEKEASKEN